MRVDDEVHLAGEVGERLGREVVRMGAACAQVAQELEHDALVVVPAPHVVRMAHALVRVAHEVLVDLEVEEHDARRRDGRLDHVLVILVERVLEAGARPRRA